VPEARTRAASVNAVPALALVIFDCDGVLVDSEAISNRVLARMLSAEGLALSTEQSRARYQGRLLAEIVADAEAELGRPLREGFADDYERRRDEAFRAELRAVPGAGAAVEAVRRAGVAVCVASQGRVAKMRLTLALTGLRGLFADGALFSAEQVPRGKPHPDLFLHAARTLGAEPASCAVVEDTPSGILAARAAAMRALGLAADSDEAALRDAGAEVVGSMAEVPARLGLA
jgi:HAD superfamily hydrolase (TIGR01509 family)